MAIPIWTRYLLLLPIVIGSTTSLIIGYLDWSAPPHPTYRIADTTDPPATAAVGGDSGVIAYSSATCRIGTTAVT